ncbi:MAG: radical SAM protein [Candidatus Hodarchaeota archaeon]
MVKKRFFPENNYKAFWFNGKTIRMAINPKMEITELQYPEFYDIKITGYCEGHCPWCYMDSSENELHYNDITAKIKDYFGLMSQNERPFQVAIGGGEPTIHPEFYKVLKLFVDLGIEPNYTTNGMHVTNDLIKNTKKLCGGVALSCHPHLEKYWEKSAIEYLSENIKLNFHIIISDKESVDYFIKIYSAWNKQIDYFVLLPYTAQGRAIHKDIDWEYLVKKMPQNINKIAFGAGFYPYLLQKDHNIKVSLYEPEIMSKFLDLKDMKLYPSSFMDE